MNETVSPKINMISMSNKFWFDFYFVIDGLGGRYYIIKKNQIFWPPLPYIITRNQKFKPAFKSW